MSRERISQAQLFAVIFEEFATRLGSAFPSIDLLKAADRLAKLIDNDFNIHREQKFAETSNYYTHDVTWAFSNRTWQIAARELQADLLGDQRLAENISAMCILHEYIDSW